MPMLSGAAGMPGPIDQPFKLRTTISAYDLIPDYGLAFNVPDDYQQKPKKFAFDNCADLRHHLQDKVDRKFLVCRHERLFRYKIGVMPSEYYLVPWMAVPATRISSGEWHPDEAIFVVTVTLDQDTSTNANSGELSRTLQLSASARINVYWAENQSDTHVYKLKDLAKTPASVVVAISDGLHGGDAGGEILIKDLADPKQKTVGKLRIIFLKKLTQRAFLINVRADGDDFVFERSMADDWKALEGDEQPASPPSGPMIKSANDFGLAQIGLKLDIADDGVDMYGEDGTKLMKAVGNPPVPTYRIKRTDIPELGQAAILALDQVAMLTAGFLKHIAHLKDSDGHGVTRFSRLYIFSTPYFIRDKKGLIDTGVEVGVPVSKTPWATATRDSALFVVDTSRQATLTHEIDESDYPGNELHRRHHTYKTLIHEIAHALLVNHYFDKSDSEAEDLFSANTGLRLYLTNRPVEHMAGTYDTDKVLVREFRLPNSDATLFDRIIDIGMKNAVDEFVDDVIFTTGKPALWDLASFTAASKERPLADLMIYVWINDLVKFGQYTTQNVMDYAGVGSRLDVNASPPEGFLPRAPVCFNRFQWELFRQSVERFSDPGFPV